jgi:hypothetical protein
MPGLELLAPALSKAAGVGAARAAGWGIKTYTARRRAAQVEKHVELPPSVLAEFGDPATAAKLMAFVRSPEIEHFTVALAKMYLIGRSDKKSSEVLEAIENEFYYSVARFVGYEPPTAAIRLLFIAINEAVLSESSRLSTGAELTPVLHAQLVQTAGNIAAASTRNTALLRSLDRLDEIHAFQRDLASQTAAMHSTMRLPHAGTSRQVPYSELFVAPDIWLAPEHGDRARGSATLADILKLKGRAVVLGDPGGGKSTQAHKLTYDLASGTLSQFADRVPFLVILRDYAQFARGNSRQSLTDYIEMLCRTPYHVDPPAGAVEYLLLNDRAVVILDGLDELLDTSLRRDVVLAVEGFAHRFPNCSMVVTSRRVGYDEAPLSEALFSRLELGKFSPRQVRQYAEKWFALDESIPPANRARLTEAFIADSTYVADLRDNPLLLSLMCGIYASERYIPTNRPDVYEKCALLLFERWDKQRGIVAPLPFDAHVQSAMRSLALFMFTEHPSEEGIPRSNLVAFMRSYLRSKRFDSDEAAENAAVEFIDFCKGRAWVLTDVGAELYGFTHRTFMEYFAASQLVRLYPNARNMFDELLPHLRNETWDVVAQLALQILGKAVEDGADDFLDLVLRTAVQDSAGVDIKLLSFAARALEFIVPRPRILNEIVDCVVRETLNAYEKTGDISEEEAIFRGLLHNVSEENRPRVAARARILLGAELEQNPLNEAALLLALISPVKRSYRNPSSVGFNLKEWADQNRTQFATAANEQLHIHPWVAIADWESGRISLSEALAIHGPQILYSFLRCGVMDDAPIYYRFLTSHIHTPAVQEPNRESREIIDSVLDFLPRQRTPWLRYRRDIGRVAPTLIRSGLATGFFDGDPKSDLDPATLREMAGAGILMALPLLEVLDAKSDIGSVDDKASLAWALIAGRHFGRDAADLRNRIEAIFSGRAEALEFVLAWIAGDRSTLSHKPAKRAARASEERSA